MISRRALLTGALALLLAPPDLRPERRLWALGGLPARTPIGWVTVHPHMVPTWYGSVPILPRLPIYADDDADGTGRYTVTLAQPHLAHPGRMYFEFRLDRPAVPPGPITAMNVREIVIR